MLDKIYIRFSNQDDAKYSREISKASFKSPHLWARGTGSVKNSIINGKVLLAFQNDNLVAWLIIQNLGGKWIRFNTTFVKKKFRNQGIARKLIRKAISANPGKMIYVSVSNRQFSDAFRRWGFTDKNLIALPIYVLLAIIIEGLELRTFFKNIKIYTRYKFHNLILISKINY